MPDRWAMSSAAGSSPDADRSALVDRLRAAGRVTSQTVEQALRTVPRHLFLPRASAAQAYQDEALIIKSGPDGLPLSSSSQPAMMAIMLEQLDVRAGHRVLEIGTGTGYNAALLAHLAGPAGRVVTVDIDPELAARASASLAAAGFPGVRVICADGSYGVPEEAPYDRIMVTAGAWDLAPAWLEQLAPGGRIVLPLSVRGVQLSVALQRAADRLTALSACRCGFIQMGGALAGPERSLPLGPPPGPYVQVSDGRPVDTWALRAALAGHPREARVDSAVTSPEQAGDADLWLALTHPRLARLTIMGFGRRGAVPALPFGALAMMAPSRDRLGIVALLPGGDTNGSGQAGIRAERLSPAGPVPAPQASRGDLVLRSFGPDGPALARHLAAGLRAWQQAGRPGTASLRIDAYPAGSPVPGLAGRIVVVKRHTTLAVSWE